jgi:uncharacterized protein YndB with AHSA1/START domain
MSQDKIVKTVVLKSTRSRVWRALTDSTEFGSWFGMKLDGPFVAGQAIRGKISPTSVDAEVAKMQEPYAGTPLEFRVEKIEPERLFSFRWHPYAIEKDVDYAVEPTTLVEFTLEPHADGILLTVTESGFEHIPLARRAKAFAANEGGWAHQMVLISKYLARHS